MDLGSTGPTSLRSNCTDETEGEGTDTGGINEEDEEEVEEEEEEEDEVPDKTSKNPSESEVNFTNDTTTTVV